MRILLLQPEFPMWRLARHWSYTVQLGLEEGFRSCGVDSVTVVSPWLRRVRSLVAGQRFDQVWLELVHSPLSCELLEWIAGVAPVRLGLLGESLEYTREECEISKAFEPRKRLVQQRMQYLTHLLAVDEHDVGASETLGGLRALWWPQAVPRRWVAEASPFRYDGKAVFSGSIYGKRRQWVSNSEVQRVLRRQPSSETGSLDPLLFNFLQAFARLGVAVRFGADGLSSLYVEALRSIRRRCFRRWIASLQTGAAVVNLPSMVKAYAGRVVEGMAACRPVVTWLVPDRPRNLALFEAEKEILLYRQESCEELVSQLERLSRDSALANSLVRNARAKLLRYHTMEQRVKQVLRWIEVGDRPEYY